jgi:hypothetical protein
MFPFRVRIAIGVGVPQPQAQTPFGGAVSSTCPVSFQSYRSLWRTLNPRRSPAARIRDTISGSAEVKATPPVCVGV